MHVYLPHNLDKYLYYVFIYLNTCLDSDAQKYVTKHLLFFFCTNLLHQIIERACIANVLIVIYFKSQSFRFRQVHLLHTNFFMTCCYTVLTSGSRQFFIYIILLIKKRCSYEVGQEGKVYKQILKLIHVNEIKIYYKHSLLCHFIVLFQLIYL